MEIKLRSTSSNIMQHRATWWPNECNMLDPTMLDDVASTCWIRLAGPLGRLRSMLGKVRASLDAMRSRQILLRSDWERVGLCIIMIMIILKFLFGAFLTLSVYIRSPKKNSNKNINKKVSSGCSVFRSVA